MFLNQKLNFFSYGLTLLGVISSCGWESLKGNAVSQAFNVVLFIIQACFKQRCDLITEVGNCTKRTAVAGGAFEIGDIKGF